MTSRTFLAPSLALILTVSLAQADPPTPVSSPLFSFPSAVSAPASGRSAALGLTDRWLGDEPFDNPAIGPVPTVSVTPVIMRVNRQDLRADSRAFADEAAFFDGAGGWAGVSIGRFGLAAYAFHPVIRFENNAFQKGERGDPAPPAIIQSHFSNREIRSGVAVSFQTGATRLGLAGEWTRREDEYFYSERSGAPGEGDRHATFDGSAFGGQAGVRVVLDGAKGLALGAAVRFVPELSLTGRQTLATFVDTSSNAIAATRESGWQGGLSARYPITSSFSLLGAFGGQTAQEWRGFDVSSGRHVGFGLGGEYHDARDPWTARFALGRETQKGTPEPRAMVIALGFGWRSGVLAFDVGAVRRMLSRPDHPTSFDDRVLGTTTVSF